MNTKNIISLSRCLTPAVFSLLAFALAARGDDLLDTVLNTSPTPAGTNTTPAVSAAAADVPLTPAPAAAEGSKALSSTADTSAMGADAPAADGARQSPESVRNSSGKGKRRKNLFSFDGTRNLPSGRQKEPVVSQVGSAGHAPEAASSHASSDVSGITLTLSLASITLGSSENYPEQGVSLSVIDLSNANYDGLRLSALDIVYGDMGGLQIGLINGSGGKLDGIQIGALNYAGRLNGLQLGFLNIAESGYGAQIGLLNFLLDNKVPVMPLINIGF